MTANYVLGIDLGTTNSVLAYADLAAEQLQIELLPIPQLVDGGVVEEHTSLPSFVHLVGEHDFTSFRASACQARHPVREVNEVSVRRNGAFVFLDITANAFLYHMVRHIAGSLIEVGKGEKSAGWIAAGLEARYRDSAGGTAVPDGLYFVTASYPARYALPSARRHVHYGLMLS